MDEERKALRNKLLILSASCSFALPLIITLLNNALIPESGTSDKVLIYSLIALYYVSLAAVAFGGMLLLFAARRLRFCQSFVIALFPCAANVLMATAMLSFLKTNSDADGLSAAYICAAYLRMIALPFLILWLCGLWSKPLKNEALYGAVSIFASYVLSSVTNWLVGGLLSTGPNSNFMRADIIRFGKAFWFDMLVEAGGYALLWLLFRKKREPQEAVDGPGE